jgi:hypothetical protein
MFKTSSHSFHGEVAMSVKLRSGVSFVLILFFVAAWLAVGAQSQETVRTLQKITHKNEPVEIAVAKVGTRRVSLGQSFMANNEWVSGLSFKVKNLSAQAIVRIELELEFPEVTRNEAILILPIAYG